MSARRLKRALSEGDDDLPQVAEEAGTTIAQAFLAGRFDEIYALCTPLLQSRTDAQRFITRWRDAIAERGGLTAYEVSNAGRIDLQYVPGLEEVDQSQFIAFVELVFSTPTVSLDQDKAFAVGVVLLNHDGVPRIGAIHAR